MHKDSITQSKHLYFVFRVGNLNTIQDFLCTLGIKPTMQLQEIVTKLLRTYDLCTGFIEVFNNFDRSGDDML